MPRVSILLTSYNHREYLPLAVESIRAQTFSDYEILALDDGSTDGSREWLAAQPDLMCHFHPKNLGTYGNLNYGIEHSTGEFIAVFNDDDLWGPRKLELQVAQMDADPLIGLNHTWGDFIGPDGNVVTGEPLGFPFPRTGTGDMFPTLIDHNQIITSSALFRRECVTKVGPFDPTFYGCGDWQMWLRIAEHYHVGHIEEKQVFYRVHPTNACRNDEKMDADSLRIREWLAARDLNERASREPALHAALAHNWACLGTARTWAGDPRAGRAAYRQSLKLRPNRWQTWVRWAATWLPTPAFRRLR